MRRFINAVSPISLYKGLIFVVPLALLWRWLALGEVLFWGTLLFQFWPWHYLVKTDVLAGVWPLWNPLLGNGAPLLANLQSAIFYPPNLLYLLLSIEHGLTLSVALHLLLAGWLMYAYTRAIGLTPCAATLSGLTYMTSGYLIGRLQFVTMINAAAWFPLLLLLAERLALRRRLNEALWLGVVLAMQLLAGHAQLWFYGLWLLTAYIVFRSWQESGGIGWPAVWGAAWRFSLAIGLSALLAAAQLLPTAELIFQSSRQGGAERAFAMTYSFWPWRLLTLLAPDFFGNPAQGNYWGYANYWEDHAYVGVLPLLLALIAMWRYGRPRLRYPSQLIPSKPNELEPIESNETARPQKKPKESFALFAPLRFIFRWLHSNSKPLPPNPYPLAPFFAALIPISLILALGWNTPVYGWVFDIVPGFKYFQAPARLLIWYTLAMAVLAGLGADSLSLMPVNRRDWLRLLVIGVSFIIAGLAGRLVLTGRSLTFATATLTLGVLLTGAIILLLTYPGGLKGVRFQRLYLPLRQVSGHLTSVMWQWLVLVFVAVDLLWFAWPLVRTLPADLYHQPMTSASALQASPGHERFFVDEAFDYTLKFNQYFRFDTFGPLDLNYWQDFKETLAPNVGVYAGLASANNDDPLPVGRQQQLVNLIKSADPAQRGRPLALMNVGYFITARNPDPGLDWPVVYANEAMTVYRLPNSLPRAYFVSSAVRVGTEAGALTQLASPNFDPRREVIIMNTYDFSPAALPSSSPAEFRPVEIKTDEPQRVALVVDAPAPGWVVLTDTFYPGWQALVDGQPASIWPANLAFRAVAVEAGTHEVVFVYNPVSFNVGLWISGITLALVVVSVGSRVASTR